MRSCNSDDFSFCSDVYPSSMMAMGTDARREGMSLHSLDFCPGDDRIALVTHVFASAYGAAVDVITAVDARVAVPN